MVWDFFCIKIRHIMTLKDYLPFNFNWNISILNIFERIGIVWITRIFFLYTKKFPPQFCIGKLESVNYVFSLVYFQTEKIEKKSTLQIHISIFRGTNLRERLTISYQIGFFYEANFNTSFLQYFAGNKTEEKRKIKDKIELTRVKRDLRP